MTKDPSRAGVPIAPITLSSPPSSSTAGFFQTPPRVPNQFYEDVALRRIFARKIFWSIFHRSTDEWPSVYLPHPVQSSTAADLSQFGASVLEPNILRWTSDAEAHPPMLHSWDIWGKRSDEMVTSGGWRALQERGIREGMVAIAYENCFAEHSRVYQFLKYHLWTGSCAFVTCPSAMTDGAARLLSRHVHESEPLRRPYQNLTSRDPARAWTSGQWMTERVGGSDVRNTETIATNSPSLSASDPVVSKDAHGAPLGPWLLNGFKWFSSATDANMAILLANTEQGISAFYAPMWRTGSQASTAAGPPLHELNGITIQRLKTKLGTHALPTAELVLQDTRAWLIGKPGHGIKEISTVLNITRVHNAVTACGLFGRGLAISRAFARVRRVHGKRLTEVIPHMRTMSKQHLEYRANMQITYFVVALLGVCERGSGLALAQTSCSHLVPTDPVASLLLRLLTPLVKAVTAKAAIAGLAECMESLGGVGYLDSSSPLDIGTNIARLYRDANVLSIWEGTTDVMADDMMRVLKGSTGKEVLSALDTWINARISSWDAHTSLGRTVGSGILWLRWLSLAHDIQTRQDGQLARDARDLMERIGWIVSAVLLVDDASSDNDAVTLEVARRWVARAWPGSALSDWAEAAEWDRKIVLGTGDGFGGLSGKL